MLTALQPAAGTFDQQEQDNAEKREFPRDPAKDLCEIRLPSNGFIAGCMIQDISSRGARLMVSCGDLPSRFILVNHTRRTRQLCRMVWRDGARLGVLFLTGPRPCEPGDSL